MTETFLDGRVTLHPGDCLEVLARLPECSVDSVVTDPPYHLTSIVQRFGGEDAKPVKSYKTGAYGGGFSTEGTGTGAAFARMSRGFMGKQWDGGDIAFTVDLWKQVWRVLKPGGHLLAFGGTRTYHRMACAIEDAGFEIRDCIQWIYGSGFPKSHDVSKGIDRAAGAEREVVGNGAFASRRPRATAETNIDGAEYGFGPGHSITAPSTDAARQWEGWGTALKPACEPIVMARKLLSESTVAANVLKWGTGAINVDGCRVASSAEDQRAMERVIGFNKSYSHGEPGLSLAGSADGSLHKRDRTEFDATLGRWPANVIHDGSEEVVGAFPDGRSSGHINSSRETNDSVAPVKFCPKSEAIPGVNTYADSGSAARFFYTAKADQDDRLGSKHPTVKPLDLMQYLVRLVTPPQGVVLDPFAGTGTTGEAAWREGFSAILIEREEEYQADIRRRMALALAGPDEKLHAIVKAKGLTADPGPLFGGEW